MTQEPTLSGMFRRQRDPIILALVAGLPSIERQRAELPANVVPLRRKKSQAA